MEFTHPVRILREKLRSETAFTGTEEIRFPDGLFRKIRIVGWCGQGQSQAEQDCTSTNC